MRSWDRSGTVDNLIGCCNETEGGGEGYWWGAGIEVWFCAGIDGQAEDWGGEREGGKEREDTGEREEEGCWGVHVLFGGLSSVEVVSRVVVWGKEE